MATGEPRELTTASLASARAIGIFGLTGRPEWAVIINPYYEIKLGKGFHKIAHIDTRTVRAIDFQLSFSYCSTLSKKFNGLAADRWQLDKSASIWPTYYYHFRVIIALSKPERMEKYAAIRFHRIDSHE